VEITGGTIQDWPIGTGMFEDTVALKIGDSAQMGENDVDIYLLTGKMFTVYDDYAGTASVKTEDSVPDNTLRQITTADASHEKREHFTSVDGYSVGHWEDYIFLYRHVHNWDYAGAGNKVTATCTITSVPSCQYHEEGLELVITAEDMDYNGAPYDKATFTNAITAVTGAQPGAITYLNAENQVINAPVERGVYTARIEIGGAVAEDPFTIGRSYTVRYVVDGEIVSTQTIIHGGDAIPPQIPGKTGYDQTAPTWDHDGKNITTDLTITAEYTPNVYTVKYVADGEVVSTQTIVHGDDAVPPQIPGKTGCDQTAPTWDHDGKNITTDLTIQAEYTPNVYTVTYMADGKVVKTVEVVYGGDAEAPDVPAKDGNTGAWDKEAKNVTSDLTIQAVYTPVPVTPATGDTFPVGLLAGVVVISFAAILALRPGKRRI
jgi:hypothetical protein